VVVEVVYRDSTGAGNDGEFGINRKEMEIEDCGGVGECLCESSRSIVRLCSVYPLLGLSD
jgi:hypothetical protein